MPDQQVPDSAVGPAVAGRVVDMEHAPVGQDDLSRALDLQEEDIHRVLQPGNLIASSVQQPEPVDLVPRVVGHQRPFPVPPHDAGPFEAFSKEAQVRLDQVIGHPVDRHRVVEARKAGSIEDRLVVARKSDFFRSAPAPVRDKPLPHGILDCLPVERFVEEREKLVQHGFHIPHRVSVFAEVDRFLRVESRIVGEASLDGLLQGGPGKVVR